MDYARIYREFIADRLGKQPESPTYFERHHILPRSLGGGDEPDNMIRLTAEDHIFAHVLLAKWKNDRGSWAAVKFIFGNSCNKLRSPTRREIRLAAKAREKFASRNSGENNPNYGKLMTDAQKEKLRQANIGKKRSADSIEKARVKAIGRPSPRKGCRLPAEQIEKLREKSTGRKHSADTVEKIRAANAGRKFSEEHKSKISAAMRGKKKSAHVSNETREKLSNALKGRTFSEDTLKKLSEARKGKSHTAATRELFSLTRSGAGNARAKAVMCISTGETFGCIKAAAEKFGFPHSSLRAALNRADGDAITHGLAFRKV